MTNPRRNLWMYFMRAWPKAKLRTLRCGRPSFRCCIRAEFSANRFTGLPFSFTRAHDRCKQRVYLSTSHAVLLVRIKFRMKSARESLRESHVCALRPAYDSESEMALLRNPATPDSAVIKAIGAHAMGISFRKSIPSLTTSEWGERAPTSLKSACLSSWGR